MTESEFQAIFEDLQGYLAALIATKAPLARVYSRDSFDENEAVWLGRLKSPDDSNRVHCYTVSFSGVPSIDPTSAIATDIFEPVFRIRGYHYFDFGTDASNSTRLFQDELNSIRFALLNDRTLGVPFIADHDGFRERKALMKIDTQTVHFAAANLKFRTYPIPYTYQ